MNYLVWAKEISQFKKVQDNLEEKVTSLIEQYFNNNDEYAIEKFIKSFCEPIRNFERLMLYHHGIHPSQLQHKRISISLDLNKLKNETDEVQRIVQSELNRHYWHYQTFIPSIKRG